MPTWAVAFPRVCSCHGAAPIQLHRGIAPWSSAPLYSYLCLEMSHQICLLPQLVLCLLPALSTSPGWELCPSCAGAVRVLCGWVDPRVSCEEHMLSSWWFMRNMFMLIICPHQQVKDSFGVLSTPPGFFFHCPRQMTCALPKNGN